MPTGGGGGGSGGGGGFTRLYNSTLTGAAASFDTGANAIAAGYSAIMVVLYCRGDTAANSISTVVTFNGDTGAHYDQAFIRNNNGAASAGESAAGTSLNLGYFPAASATASFFGSAQWLIPNYDNASNFKAGNAQFGFFAITATAEQSWQTAFQWHSTSALNQIKVATSAGNFVTGSRMTIYGLL